MPTLIQKSDHIKFRCLEIAKLTQQLAVEVLTNDQRKIIVDNIKIHQAVIKQLSK